MSDAAKGHLQLILVIAFIVSAVVISQLLGYVHTPPQTREGGNRVLFVEAMQAHSGTHHISIETSGIVQARGMIDVTPQVSGQIVHVHPDFYAGGHFKKNELLFQIERSDYRNEVKRLEAQVATAETALELEKAEAEAALAEWKLLNNDKAAPDLVARKPQMAEAQATLKAAKAQLANAQLNLKRTRYQLPFNGRVTESALALGQYVTAGQSYGTVFNIDTLEVRASLNDAQLEWLMEAGKETDVTLTARYLGKEHHYSGEFLRGAASLEDSTRFSAAIFGFETAPNALVPGVFTTINIKGAKRDNAMKLPNKALQKEGWVWLIDESDQLKKWEPEIIYEDEKQLIVKANGEQATVVTSRLSGAAEGMSVKLRESSSD